jgi:hypothetical protein
MRNCPSFTGEFTRFLGEIEVGAVVRVSSWETIVSLLPLASRELFL